MGYDQDCSETSLPHRHHAHRISSKSGRIEMIDSVPGHPLSKFIKEDLELSSQGTPGEEIYRRDFTLSHVLESFSFSGFNIFIPDRHVRGVVPNRF